jgi:hypothetical protein
MQFLERRFDKSLLNAPNIQVWAKRLIERSD